MARDRRVTFEVRADGSVVFRGPLNNWMAIRAEPARYSMLMFGVIMTASWLARSVAFPSERSMVPILAASPLVIIAVAYGVVSVTVGRMVVTADHSGVAQDLWVGQRRLITVTRLAWSDVRAIRAKPVAEVFCIEFKTRNAAPVFGAGLSEADAAAAVGWIERLRESRGAPSERARTN